MRSAGALFLFAAASSAGPATLKRSNLSSGKTQPWFLIAVGTTICELKAVGMIV
jgi:hypothetical protein